MMRDMDNEQIKRMLVIAYSSGYEAGHNDTVEGIFNGNGRSEHHDQDALAWIDEAQWDGTFERELDV
jgi:hypothetical protein